MDVSWDVIEEFDDMLREIEREIADEILRESQLALDREIENYLLNNNDKLRKRRNYDG